MKLTELLEVTTKQFPPGQNQHHNILLIEGELVLCLMFGEKCQPVHLGESDLEKTTEDFLKELETLMESEA